MCEISDTPTPEEDRLSRSGSSVKRAVPKERKKIMGQPLLQKK